MKIGILGGSFDPPHLGHILLAQQIIALAKVEQVWLLPNYSITAHHKVFQKKLSTFKDRFTMTQLVENEKIKTSDFEVKHNKKSITITTLKLITKKYPQHAFYWITGSDKLATFYLWDDWKEIVSKYNLIIFPRKHSRSELEKKVKESLQLQTIPKNVIVLHDKSLITSNISSTMIRERVKNGLPVDFLVQPAVEKYIKEYKLYE